MLPKILIRFIWVPFKIVLQYGAPFNSNYTTLAGSSKHGVRLFLLKLIQNIDKELV